MPKTYANVVLQATYLERSGFTGHICTFYWVLNFKRILALRNQHFADASCIYCSDAGNHKSVIDNYNSIQYNAEQSLQE